MPNAKATDPHTMVFLSSGMMLFTVQAGNFVGSLDPKAPTGNIKLVSPPTANARPYGIMLDSKEIAFFDEFNAPNIGSIDPKTMHITEYPLPDKGARPRRICGREGRHRVVRRLRARLSRPSRSRNEEGRRVQVARRRGFEAVRDSS